jgi:flagellar basal-body rod modification protein FlgD
MRIDGTADSTAGALAGTGVPATSKDEFLRLLVAQLQHQDPLQPQDGAQMVAQLAQFASLEQSAETNQRLAALADGQSSSIRSAMVGLVGRTVEAAADDIEIDPTGGPPALAARLDGPASKVELIVRDASGAEVRRIDCGASPGGLVAAAWDGTDAKGAPLPAGSYHVEVSATGTDGAPVGAHAVVRGLVSAVDFSDGNVLLRIGGVVVSPGAIATVEA